MTVRSHRDFFTAFLTGLSIPVRLSSLRTLAAVSIFESSQGNNSWWNPLACEEPWAGATPYNKAGVQIYPSFDAGVAATDAMFSGAHWGAVRLSLRHDTWRGPMLDAFSAAYTWADVNFRALFTTTQMDARLVHTLRGP